MFAVRMPMATPLGRRAASRRGLSMLELLGCLLAVAVGIWVGAAYFGVDLKAALEVGITQSGAAKSADETPETQDGDGAAAQAETAPDAAPSANPDGSPTPTPARRSDDSASQATLAFWTQLREIIRQEQLLQLQHEEPLSSNSRAVLRARGDAFRKAAAAVRQLSSASVDPEAVQVSHALAAWYERGAELSHEGAVVLDEAELTTGQGPMGRRWHTACRQHRDEFDLLGRKIDSLQGKLVTRYRLTFPELR